MLEAVMRIYPDLAETLSEGNYDKTYQPQSSKEESNAKFQKAKDKLFSMLAHQRKYSQRYYADYCLVSEPTISKWVREWEAGL